jgi:dipeptide/tripeptide permease
MCWGENASRVLERQSIESSLLQRAVTEKIRRRKTDHKDHWLDYAEEKHGVKLVTETKTVMNILVLYLPLPIYWAVYMQQASRWVFQATRMDGNLGFYTVQPDQMIALNPIFAILTLPLCDYVFYPLLAKFHIKTLLQKMTIGGFLAVIAFIFAAVVEMKIQEDIISIFWLAPQYLILALSENFLYVSHLSFAYNEASPRMKSVMMSSVYIVIAIGNLFVVFISGTKLFESQSTEFFFFAGILFVFMILFGVLASRYEPYNQVDDKQVD